MRRGLSLLGILEEPFLLFGLLGSVVQPEERVRVGANRLLITQHEFEPIALIGDALERLLEIFSGAKDASFDQALAVVLVASDVCVQRLDLFADDKPSADTSLSRRHASCGPFYVRGAGE